jgi:hypothetical protein
LRSGGSASAAAARARQVSSARRHSTTVDRGGRHVGPLFRPAGRLGSREAIIRRPPGGRWRRCVTPRQACPRPNGFGRNLRSKTRWFTGFCNSHQVSHFATFFIDARAEISVAESRFVSLRMAWDAAPGDRHACPALVPFSLAPGAPGFRCRGSGLRRAVALPRPGSFLPTGPRVSLVSGHRQ